MRINVSSYIPGTSAVHACDARVKIVLLAAYSVTLFLVRSWMGLGLCALLFVAVATASRIPARRFFGLLVPVYVIVAFTVLFNGFSLDVGQAASAAPPALGDVSAGVLAAWEPVALIGSFGLVPAGLARGLFFAVRIVLLVVASLAVTYTTTSTELTDALGFFLRPLKRLGVPTDDIAMVFSLALRFIPVTAEEFGRVHDAQWARGASFAEGFPCLSGCSGVPIRWLSPWTRAATAPLMSSAPRLRRARSRGAAASCWRWACWHASFWPCGCSSAIASFDVIRHVFMVY